MNSITHALCEEYHGASTPLSWRVDHGIPLLQLDLDNTLDYVKSLLVLQIFSTSRKSGNISHMLKQISSRRSTFLHQSKTSQLCSRKNVWLGEVPGLPEIALDW